MVSGWTKNTQKPNFFENGKNHPKFKNSKTSRNMPKFWPEVSNPSGSVVSTRFCHAKSAKKHFYCLAILDHFITKMFKSETTSLHYFSPRIPNLEKILDIRLWEVGANRRLTGTSKVNTHTDRQTDRRTDKSTYRKHRPRGPMLWKRLCLPTLPIEEPQQLTTPLKWTKKKKNISTASKLTNFIRFIRIENIYFDMIHVQL